MLEAFSTHGTVSGVDVIVDRETGRPRGFAFVEMEDPRRRTPPSRRSTDPTSAAGTCV